MQKNTNLCVDLKTVMQNGKYQSLMQPLKLRDQEMKRIEQTDKKGRYLSTSPFSGFP